MDLRYYQKEAIKAIEEGWKDYRRQLLVMATGTGKTVVFDTLAAKYAKEGQRILIMAHRDELIEQARKRYTRLTRQKTAKEKGKETSIGSDCRVVVGSVQTLSRRNRLDKFPSNYFDTIIVDEAHHTLADGYMRILNHFSNARVLGVTATPDRGDKKNLASFYENTAYDYSLDRAVEDGFLSRITARTIPISIDMRDVNVKRGDFELGSTAEALKPCLKSIAKALKKYAYDRKIIVFLPLVSIAREFRDILLMEGFNAREVNGDSPDRKQTLEWFDRAKAGSVLCNAMLLTEGYDCPSCDCIVVLRPTKIRSLYCQCVGRGTRIFPGKKDLLLLDFLWLTAKHNLCHPSVLAIDDVKRAGVIDVKEGEVDVFDIVRDRRKGLAEELLRNAGRHMRVLNPVNWLECIGDYKAADHECVYSWELDDMTEKQRQCLERNGISTKNVNKGMARLIIADIVKRAELGLSTPKQMKLLTGFGYKNVGEWTFKTASEKIDELAKAKWNVSKLDTKPEYYRPHR